MARAIDNLKELLENFELYQESANPKPHRQHGAKIRKYNLSRLHQADFVNLYALYHDLCRTGQSLTSWTAIKEICEQCGLTAEPWDEISWTIKA